MARTVSPFRIGIFALLCLALIGGAIIWLGAASFLENFKTYAAYFNVSVKGLQKDAVVNYRGVPIGRVDRIGIAPDGRLVEVLIKLKADFRVDGNIAAQLREQGLTGLRYLEIDTAPENIDQLTPKITFVTKYPIIKTYPSEIEMLKGALQDLYLKFSALDLKSLTESWTRTSEMANDLLAQLGAGTGRADLRETITSLRKASEHSAALMERLSSVASRERLNKGFNELTGALSSVRQTSDTLARELETLPPGTLKRLAQQFGETMETGGTAFSNLRVKIDESAGLLEHNLLQLKVLLNQLNSLVGSLREQPNRLIIPAREQPEPFKKK